MTGSGRMSPTGGPTATWRPYLSVADVSIWLLVQEFFKAKSIFAPMFESYETQVLRQAEERGVDRRFLRLDAEGLSELLDFRALERLRDGSLADLKTISHELFRGATTTDKFDRYVSELYHEASILKEEHYRVSRFARGYDMSTEGQSYEDALDEVHEQFPRKVHGIHDLFERAKARLEEIIPGHRDDKVFVRSLYLFGEELLTDSYPEGLDGFYWVIYGGGPPEGYLVAGESFLASGFQEPAQACFERGVTYGEKLADFLADNADAQRALVTARRHVEDLRSKGDELKGSGSTRSPEDAPKGEEVA